MARIKINPEELQRLLAEGRSQAEAARHFGVSEAAISQRLKRLTGLTSRVVALEKASDVVDQKLRVRLVLDEGQTVGRVSRDLDLTESALRKWVDYARADRTKGRTGVTSEEREELRQLRKENRRLRMERDVLKKATAFFARESE